MANSEQSKTNNNLVSGSIIIEGITPEGREFRPSDWAERLCGDLCTTKGNRLHYNPMLVPMTNPEGHKCVIIDAELANVYPDLFDSLLEFAEKNRLKVARQTNDETCPIEL